MISCYATNYLLASYPYSLIPSLNEQYDDLLVLRNGAEEHEPRQSTNEIKKLEPRKPAQRSCQPHPVPPEKFPSRGVKTDENERELSEVLKEHKDRQSRLRQRYGGAKEHQEQSSDDTRNQRRTVRQRIDSMTDLDDQSPPRRVESGRITAMPLTVRSKQEGSHNIRTVNKSLHDMELSHSLENDSE